MKRDWKRTAQQCSADAMKVRHDFGLRIAKLKRRLRVLAKEPHHDKAILDWIQRGGSFYHAGDRWYAEGEKYEHHSPSVRKAIAAALSEKAERRAGKKR